MKVCVIGAGITGITTAYALAKRGVDVTVIDAEPYAGMKTSYANGGQLSVSNSDVWTTWPNVIKGLKWILKKDAPFLINPTPSLSKLKWLTKFLMATASGESELNTIETIKLGLRARELYYEIAEEECIEFDLTQRGILHFYNNQEYFDAAKKSCDLYNKLGVERHILTPDQINEREPALITRNVIGGTYTPSDANGDIHRFCTLLSRKLVENYGVTFIYNYRVEYLPIYADIYDHVVLCAGVDSVNLSKQIKDPIDIYPVKGYSITLYVGNSYAAPRVSLLDDEAKIVSSRLGDRFRVAGTAELAGYNYDIRKDRIDPLVNWVKNNFRNIDTEHVIPWAGLRPMTPNMLPVVRRSRVPNIWYNTGHGHLGWTLRAATAEIISEQIIMCTKSAK